jgi:cholesterol transport system auxiliary component
MSRFAPALAAGVLCLGLAGCASTPPTTYDIVAARSFAPATRSAKYQLVVSEPVAVTQLDTTRIMVKPSADTVSYYKGVAWSDRLPRLVQTRMVETIQNSGAVKSVGTTTGDYTLATELRSFQIDASNGHVAADVELLAKLVNNSGKVVATKGFSAHVPASSDAPTQAVAALNQGFTEVLQDTTTWVASRH